MRTNCGDRGVADSVDVLGANKKQRPRPQKGDGGRGGETFGRDGQSAYLGPNGHVYNLGPDEGPPTTATATDEQDIHALIAKRMQCKMRRNFQEEKRIGRYRQRL